MLTAEQITQVDAEERALILPRFSNEDGWALGVTLRDLAIAQSAPLAIAVHRGATCLFFTTLAGASPNNAGWIGRKMAIASRFERSSYAMEQTCRLKGIGLEHYGLDASHYALAGGAVPIRVEGVGVVGVAVVSGLAGHEDHALVIEALTKLKAAMAGAGRATS